MEEGCTEENVSYADSSRKCIYLYTSADILETDFSNCQEHRSNISTPYVVHNDGDYGDEQDCWLVNYFCKNSLLSHTSLAPWANIQCQPMLISIGFLLHLSCPVSYFCFPFDKLLVDMSLSVSWDCFPVTRPLNKVRRPGWVHEAAVTGRCVFYFYISTEAPLSSNELCTQTLNSGHTLTHMAFFMVEVHGCSCYHTDLM